MHTGWCYERCPRFIARFDLDSVAWLQEVKEPNKIQLAFIAIISLLTEVKPYAACAPFFGFYILWLYVPDFSSPVT